MTTAILTPGVSARAAAERALKLAAGVWLTTAIAGQALFLTYILAFYGPSTLGGDFAAWAKNESLIKGYVPGDTAGNLAFGAHVLMAAVVTFGGTLQLVPQLRARAPGAHRWIGRAFLTTAILASLVGVWMTWGRPTFSSLPSAIAITLDAALILIFGGLAWRAAVKRDLAAHRRWAMRAFLVANSVWFLRLGMAAYGVARMATGNVLPRMGDAFEVWSFGAYLVPLLILEGYLQAQARGGTAIRFTAAGGIALCTLLMAIGVAGTWIGMFGPLLSNL
ncbi:DUF2306 domain-containing protein [Phenylobacterium sp.]|uniref:DUF2306 domain-containing protein n=1 Tax=Phenylobacterium sp. TaxID=1871053 RepID=UPI0025E7ADF8|nr:DUF2306 domain-containing protein [Phenylobacterium sp.]